jgi:hemerythrin
MWVEMPQMTPWGPHFETGHPQIDAEHRQFFQRLGEIQDAIEAGAGRERIVELIAVLQQYALIHFSREEDFMRSVRCPAYKDNCAAHKAFGLKFDGWLQLLSTSGSSVTLLQDIHRESVAWIEAHIVDVDCKLRGCKRDEVRVPA